MKFLEAHNILRWIWIPYPSIYRCCNISKSSIKRAVRSFIQTDKFLINGAFFSLQLLLVWCVVVIGVVVAQQPPPSTLHLTTYASLHIRINFYTSLIHLNLPLLLFNARYVCVCALFLLSRHFCCHFA